jgi:hypothetical protein
MDDLIHVAQEPAEILVAEIEGWSIKRTFDNFKVLAVLLIKGKPVEQLIDSLPCTQAIPPPGKKQNLVAIFEEIDCQVASDKARTAG